MNEKRQVIFRITKTHGNGETVITVEPELLNISRENGGEYVLLAMAANCLRMVAKKDGLERALERLCEFATNNTRVRRP